MSAGVGVHGQWNQDYPESRKKAEQGILQTQCERHKPVARWDAHHNVNLCNQGYQGLANTKAKPNRAIEAPMQGCISLSVRGTLIFSSARSEIVVDQPDPIENSSVGAAYSEQRQGRCRLYEALHFRGNVENSATADW